tara:strand:+ start:65293 stop:69840 length:4548 start_codon:yes stop_codon:yes gene_type:complete
MSKYFWILGLLLIPFVGISQKSVEAFSKDFEKFPKTVEGYLQKSNKSESEKLGKALETVWMSEYYSADEQARIIDEANALVNIKVRNFPDFSSYIDMIIRYPESGMDKNQFAEWFDVIENYSKSAAKKKKLIQLLSFSTGFFDTKSLYRTQSKSVNWKVDEYNFTFQVTPKTVNLVFGNVNLSCEAKGNQIEMLNTTGIFNVFDNSWKGESGKVTFKRAGADPTKVWVDINSYFIDLKHSNYQADSVIYHNSKFLKEPLIGSLVDKVLAKQTQERTSYPRFQSYNVHIPINDLVKEVDYMGGFAQQGGRIIGTGTDDEPAVLQFEREGKPFMKITSKRFLMNINDATDEELEEDPEKGNKKEVKNKKKVRSSIVSSTARVVIYMDGDSILHPGLKLNFYTDERLVNLIRVRGEMSETPYANTFHKVEMRFQLLSWKMDYPVIDFTSFGMDKDRSASFESEGFFKRTFYENLMGASSWHPLARMKSCATKYDTNVLSLREITGCLQIPVTGVEPMLLRYTVMGYLSYNQDIKEVTLYPKLFHQVSANSKKEDFDVIQVYSNGNSSKSGKNATLNLLNFDLTIYGVKSVTLSKNHSVKVLPDSGIIVMKRNRNFDFNGIISSGKVDFYGNGFSFNYDDFKLEMPILDSMQIWATTKEVDSRGYQMEARVRTVIEDLTGDLKIDHPKNKSGNEIIPEYPIFKSKENSYAYYDKKSVFNKIYDRSNFYFELKPFEIDSLDKFKNEGIAFEGTFYSAGILPDIEESLTLQEDYSLGFTRKAPPEGYLLYGDKGHFKNEINLSDRGLRGDGYITYITSTAASDNFYFFPKEVRGVTKMVEIEEQLAAVEYPNVLADTTRLRWIPYQDEYFLSSMKGKSPITMFGGNVKHRGRLKYTPTDLTGRGMSAFEGAKLYSDSMIYTFYNIHADTSNFELSSKSFSTLDFSSENVMADINFKDRKGQFVSNTGASLTKFDRVMYQAYLDRFTWFMDNEELELSAAGGKVKNGANEVQVEGAEFISINPHQDSLRFYAKTARYSLQKVRLQAREVKLINVADAEIIPNKGLVTIYEEAKMDRLDSSIIIANTEFRYHKIYDASTQITGRWKFKSSGKYDYVDENGLTQILEFTDVGVDTTRQTFAKGIILGDDDFSLSPMYRYKGDVGLKANRKNLNFDGYGRLVHECEQIPATWFTFEGEVDPNEIIIQIDENMIDQDENALYASMIMPRDSNLMYGAFIDQKRSYRDVDVSLATGYLEFDPSGRKYRISNLQKLNEPTYPGNYVAIDIKKCSLEGEGKLQLTQKTGRVEVQAVGNYSYNSINNEAKLHASMTVDFLFDDGLMDMIVADAQKSELNPTEEDPNYELTLRELLSKEAADEMISRIGLAKNVKVPTELRKTIFFSKLDLVWNEDTKSYISQGKIGVGNMGKTSVNMLFDGGIELVQKRGNTDIVMYLEVSPSKWYMFSYRGSTGIMMVYSSNKDFMSKMMEIKSDKKRIKREGEKKQYSYQAGSKRARALFIQRLEDAK